MIDFTKKLQTKNIQRKIHPVEIYSVLDRKSETGPLRPAQEDILNNWYAHHKEDRDLIIKLHTGEGKTLIGLLVLMSRVNANEGPCIYVCPNIYLVNQVCMEADKFGIPTCVIDSSNTLPDDFLQGKSILVTHVHKIFNGLTKFGIHSKSAKVNTIVLDDSHTCVETIKSSLSINIRKTEDEELYAKLKTLFEDDLVEQGEGSYYDLDSSYSEVVMAIPYWAWIDKSLQITKLLSQNKERDAIKFTWPLIRDSIKHCQAFISNSKIEIVPVTTLVDAFETFSRAKQRILMSATTQDDSFFIKGLNFS